MVINKSFDKVDDVERLVVVIHSVTPFSFFYKKEIMEVFENTTNILNILDLSQMQFMNSYFLSLIFDLLVYFRINKHRQITIIIKDNKFANLLYRSVQNFKCETNTNIQLIK